MKFERKLVSWRLGHAAPLIDTVLAGRGINAIQNTASFGAALVGSGWSSNCGRSSPDVQNAHQFSCEIASLGKNSTPVRFTSSW